MPSTLNQTIFQRLMETVFTGIGIGGVAPPAIVGCRMYGGVQPANPTIEEGATQLQAAILPLAAGTWLSQSGGVCALSGAISLTPEATETFVFLRLYDSSNVGVMDIPVGIDGSGEPGMVSTVDASQGVPLSLTALSFKVGSVGGALLSSSVATFLLHSLTNNPVPHGFTYNQLCAASKVNAETAGADETQIVDIEVWAGDIPASADTVPTGVKLWATYITGAQVELFNVSGAGLALKDPMTSSATANGVPTFVRVVKRDTGIMPECTIQIPIGPGAVILPATQSAGQQATLVVLALTL